MFRKFLEEHREEMINTLAGLIAVPSISRQEGGKYCYGKDVDDALTYVRDAARSFGFEAENLGYMTEVRFGHGDKTVYIACHADVVPAGDGWHTDPFALTRKDGKLFGRGVEDNKGPVVAVLYALRALREAGLEPKASVRLLVGGAEETGMDDIPQYTAVHGFPDYGLTPDSSFPIVNTEAGMFDGELYFGDAYRNEGCVRLLSLRGGVASNCVPDSATAVLEADDPAVVTAFFTPENTAFLKDFSWKTEDGNRILLTTRGINAHASVANRGKNALTDLAVLLQRLFEHMGVVNRLTEVLSRYFADDFDASRLGLSCRGEILGSITLNVGICDTEKGYFTVDMRLPVAGICEKIRQRYEQLAKEYGFRLEIRKLKEYTHIPKESEFMQKLGAAFEHVTGRKAEYFGCCGLTYAKVLGGRGVAFGPAFEDGDESGNIHGDDEFIREDVLIRLAAVYAQVIYELWC